MCSCLFILKETKDSSPFFPKVKIFYFGGRVRVVLKTTINSKGGNAGPTREVLCKTTVYSFKQQRPEGSRQACRGLLDVLFGPGVQILLLYSLTVLEGQAAPEMVFSLSQARIPPHGNRTHHRGLTSAPASRPHSALGRHIRLSWRIE